MNPEVVKELGKLSSGVITALGLVAALYVIWEQNQTLGTLLERQTVAIETIAKTYTGE